MDDKLDTRRLRYFMQVLETGSVRGAARTHIERTLRELTRVGAAAYVAQLAEKVPPETTG